MTTSGTARQSAAASAWQGAPTLRAPAAYMVAVFSVAICFAVRLLLESVLEGQGTYLVFMLAVAAAAYAGGTGPGLASIAVSAIAGDWLEGGTALGRAAVAQSCLFMLESTGVVLLIRRLQQANVRASHSLGLVESARRDLEKANLAKEQFVARISHEWRSPLTTIGGWIWQLERRPDQPEIVRRAADGLKQAVNTQARLISDLLDYSRGTQGKLTVTPERVDLASVIHNAVDTVAADARGKDVSIAIAPAVDGIRPWGDAVRLQQVFSNLLHNAVKFTPASGRVRVFAHTDEDTVEVAIVDSGIGIDRQSLSTIFDPFTQSDEARDAGQGGLGLGLSIVREIVTLHGGSIWASSAGQGRGSTFSVRLPLAKARSERSDDAVGGQGRQALH